MNKFPAECKAFIFDFDGTLAKLNIDFALMHASVSALTLSRRIPPVKLAGMYTLEMIEAAVAFLAETDKKEAARFHEDAFFAVTAIEVAAARTGELFPGSKPLLTELRRRSIKTAIVTRNCRAAVLQVFPDIGHYADATLTREDSQNVKPHPDHLQKTFAILGVDNSEAVMIGDHPMDIIAARQAGCRSIGVLTGNTDAQSLREAGAERILADASEILRTL